MKSCQPDSIIALLGMDLQDPMGNRRVLGLGGAEILQIKI